MNTAELETRHSIEERAARAQPDMLAHFMAHAPDDIPQWYQFAFPKHNPPARPNFDALSRDDQELWRNTDGLDFVDDDQVSPTLIEYRDALKQYHADLDKWTKRHAEVMYWAWRRYYGERMVEAHTFASVAISS